MKIWVFGLTRARLEIINRVNTIYSYHYLNIGIRGLKIASRSNLESGPRFAKVCKQLTRKHYTSTKYLDFRQMSLHHDNIAEHDGVTLMSDDDV